ncbi:ATP-dependent helicase [Nonomuraea sp. KC401]|uniref:ATP-dependent helicase n=1 Tax=unclassified Nonomuraea TaxID=2593643 RepID=UPI0010FE9E15|nr:ATP-dependent DNA helicase [Nonomuraea sp. KC401]NBE97023.1 UvrD-helicase domain-containing protein [Nonomuraea sp. K271]TLF71620.1 ATP-dependent helicase [Nonomuraea sp. KC401]
MLDEHQRAVVEHKGGPLLVLAGPGTGKTTTIVESVVHRIERRGIDPERVLILTFSRKAAEELRRRVTARLRRTTRTPLALTFHSYAYALLRRESVLEGRPPPRLLTGPEQLLEIRRLLHGELENGALDWPASLREPLRTRGFAEELRDFLSRANERGLDPERLVALGRRHGRADWAAAGRFAGRYQDRFDLDPEETFDYAELVRAASALLDSPGVLARERAAHDVVFVDEYQDTDPAQELLLARLAGDGRDLVAVGDPDQSIYGFRGADVQGIMQFPERFPARDGRPAPVLALRVCRRSGAGLLEASRRLAARLPVAPVPDHVHGHEHDHRDLTPLPEAEAGEVRVLLADSTSQEAAIVADTLRRAHLIDGVPWHRMAVLVRSAKRQVPLLRRALVNAGVPTMIAGDEVPIAQEPGVRPLLTMLRVALDPSQLDEAVAEELLTGPLGGTDMIGVRRLRRALKIAENDAVAALRETGTGDDERPLAARSSGELLVAAVQDARELTRVEPHVALPAERVARLLATAREAARQEGTAEDLLWAVWQGSGLSERWTDLSLSGGPRGAQADRDLDAVVALFDHAARFVDRMPKAGPEVFIDDLAAQEIPGDTLADRAPDGDAVRVLTAHRSKGLEWDVVVVAGVQEGVWPDLRLRGSLLGVEDLVEVVEGAEPNAASLVSKLLAEERRLFYVAATRARRRLVVTAVGGDDTDERPSRFLSELMPGAVETATVDDRARWLTMSALVADLRSAVTDPTKPARMRQKAAHQLARLAAAGVQGAHPNDWYALTSISDDRPLSWPDGVVSISPSAVESFTKCGLRWLLETAVGAAGTSTAQGLGNVIHALAVLAATDLPSEDLLGHRLDQVWNDLDFGGVWYNRKQRQVAEQMIGKFLRWHKENPRELVALEEAFTAMLSDGVQIKGRVDRVERDSGNRAVIIDLKTGGAKPKAGDLDRHPQLGVYQLAALLGAFARHGMTEPGGAALVQLGKAAGKKDALEQRQGALADDRDPGWAADLVDTVATGMSGPFFQAKVNDGCRTCAARASCPVNDNGGQVC